MSELQDESAIDEPELIEGEVIDSEIESDDDNSELAPDSEAQHEQNEPEALPDKAQQVINKKHWEAKQAERERDELKRQLEEMQAKQQAQQNVEPIVPEMPDPFDDDYEQRMQEWQQKTIERTKWETQQNLIQQQQQQMQQQQLQQQQAKLVDSVNEYTERAKSFGISQDELAQVGGLVAQAGISEDLTRELLVDPEGALIVKQLASDPQSLDALSQMSPYQAAIYINNNVRPKAQSLKPKTSNTPPPPDNLSGKSAEVSGFRHVKSNQFE